MTKGLKLVETENSALREIENCIYNPPQHSVIFTLTHQMAAYLLEKYNVGNRPKKPAKIAEFGRAMKEGRWGLTGDCLKFSGKRILRDGQNRLMASIASRSSFTTHIVFGIDDHLFAVLDRGKSRTCPDVLAIEGYKNTTILHAALRWIWLYDSGIVKQRKTLELPDQALELAAKHSYVTDLIPLAQRIASKTGQPAGMTAAFLYLFHRANQPKLSEFAHAWETGAWLKRSPIGKMQKEISKIQGASSGRIHDVVRAALVVIAWNLFIAGKTGVTADFTFDPSEAGKPFPVIAENPKRPPP